MSPRTRTPWTRVLPVLLVLLGLWTDPGRTLDLDELFPFGAEAGDERLPPGSDSFRGLDLSGSVLLYHGGSYSKVYISTNGFVSFSEPPAEEKYLGKGPAGFPLIAALLGDLEGALEWALEGDGQGQVHFRWDSSPEVLERAAGLVQRAFPRDEGVEPNGALIVTWENMAAGGPSGRGDGPDNKRNTFQLVLVSLQSSSCAVLLYPRAGLQFLSTAIGGQNKPLEAGFNEGLVTSWIWGQTQGEYTRITTDDEASVQELTEKTNSGQAGVWVYEIGAEPFFVGIVPGLVPEVENATAPAVTMLPRQPDQPQVPSEESPTEATPEYETTYPDLEEDFPTETPTEYTTTFPEETEEPFYDYDEDETVTYPELDRVPTTQPDTPEPSYPEPTQTASPVSEPLQPRNTVPENVEPGYSESSYPEPDEVQPRFTDPKPVQPQPPYSGPQQPHIVVVDEDEDINVNVFAYNSETCAYNGHKCSAFADCRDYSSGYCCHCRPGYYGNGKDCIAEGKPQRLNGKVNGRVFVGDSTSPVELVNNDLHTYVVANDGRVYVAISKIPDEVGPALQPLSSLGGVIGWAFALEQPGYQNGFSLIGGVFFRQAEVIFRPGNERLSIKQQFKGIDEHDHLVVSTELEGRLPEVPPGAFVHINPYKEIYQYSRNLITSSSNRDYNVTLSDGSVQTRSYQWQQTISFQSCPHDEAAPVEAPPTQQLSVDQIFAMYDADNHLSRYAMSNKIGSVHSGLPEQNPCFTGRHGCDNNAACRPAEGLQFSCECAEGFTGDGRTCHDIDECREYPPVCGFNALCSNQPGTFRCECSTGFTLASDGRTCIEENRPVDHCQRGSHDCDSANRALCSYTGGSAFVCSCLPGFTGDGRICQDVDECEQSRCHGYAVCFNTQGSYTCQCRPGFHGDGFNCSPTEREKTPCELSRESAQASTTSSILSFFRPRPAVAQYVPQCDQHGAYEPTQCHTSISQCWCVDANGQEIPNTRTGPGSTPLCIDQAVTPVPVGPTPRPDVHPVAAGTHLLFAQSGRIEHVPLDEHGIKKDQAKALLHIPDRVVIAVAFDCVEKTVYWTDITGPAISKASLDGGDIVPVITTELQSPEGLAVDHVSRLLFWTDSMKDTVEVSRLDGSQRRVLFDTDLVNPRPIVTNPPYGRLYWADWNRDGPKIETSNMDGSERSVLVKDDLELPNALSLDVSEQLLCWADAGTHRVECVDPHRRLRRTIVQEVRYPFGLVSFRGNLFYTDWRREAVVVVDRHSQKETDEFLPQRRSRPYGITMATTQCQQAYNYCSDNGGCSHLCLPRLGGFSCRCPDADDGRCVDRSL